MAKTYKTKVFTKDAPCTKVDIWNCFRSSRSFKKVPVVEAQSHIGANAPKYWLRQGWLDLQESKGAEFYTLTKEGKEHLKSGLIKYLAKNPELIRSAKFLTKDMRTQIIS